MTIVELLTIVGLTYIVTMSKLFKPVREFASKKSLFFGEVLSCQLCLGVWFGVLVFFLPSTINEVLSYISIGSISSYTAFLILQRLKIK